MCPALPSNVDSSKRLSTQSDQSKSIRPFLQHLQAKHPQLFYRPLFSLSATTSPNNLLSHLQIVRALSTSLGPAQYWTAADPQMVVIVLMGEVAPKPNKGKGREGELTKRQVKLGRYACLIHFISALDHLPQTSRKDRKLRSFIEVVETRIGLLLEAEEKDGELPTWYRTLICRLFFKLRSVTFSTKT